MTGLLMADRRNEESRLRSLLPLAPVMVSSFFVVALIWYRVQVLPGASDGAAPVGNWLAGSVAWLHARVGFLPAFLMAVLGLAWSSIWFFTGRLDRARTRVGYLFVFGLCLSIVEGLTAEASAAGSIGQFIAVRMDRVFGAFPSTLFAIAASLAAFLLATDFCFFRYFEGLRPRLLGTGSEPAPGGGAKALDIEIESAAVAELMARPGSVDGWASREDRESSSGTAVLDPDDHDPQGADEEFSSDAPTDDEIDRAAATAREQLERGSDSQRPDPLQVDDPDAELGSAEFGDESGFESLFDDLEVDDLDAGSASGQDPADESYEEGVPTIVDVGLSSVELPIASDEDSEPRPADLDDSSDDLSASVALREAGFLGRNTEQKDRDLAEPVDSDELAALLGAADGLGLEDAESAAEADRDPWAGDADPEHEAGSPDSGVSSTGWLFSHTIGEAELDDDEVDGLMHEAESLSREVEEVSAELGDPGEFGDADSRGPGSPESESSDPGRRDEEPEERHSPETSALRWDRFPSADGDSTPQTAQQDPRQDPVDDAGSVARQGALFGVVDDEELMAEAEELIRSTGRASAGLLSRRLRIEFEQADAILTRLEQRGLIAIDDESGRVRVLED